MPGLLNDRNVVVPPNAAATESWKKRSGCASVATRVWVWTSTAPGSTKSPLASIVWRALARSPSRSRSTAEIVRPVMATSAGREPVAVTTLPPEESGCPALRSSPEDSRAGVRDDAALPGTDSPRWTASAAPSLNHGIQHRVPARQLIGRGQGDRVSGSIVRRGSPAELISQNRLATHTLCGPQGRYSG